MRKAVNVLAIIFIVLIVLVGALFWGLQTPAGQNFLTRQANSYLRKKLQTRVDIDKIRFDIPDWITLEGVYIEDKQGDTLIAGDRLYVNLDMIGLIKGRVGINEVELEGIRAKINRTLPDTTFNFQFVVDAFVTDAPPTPADTAATPLEMRLDELNLRRVYLTYRDAVIGTDAEAEINTAQVLFEAFNPTKSQYHPTQITMNGARANLRMYEALATPTAEPAPATPADPADSLDIKLGDISIRNLKWDFTDETSGLKNGVSLGRLEGHVNNIYMGSQQADLRNILLENTTAFVEYAAQPARKSSPEPAPATPADTSASADWNVRVGQIKLVNNALMYDDFNEPRQPKGLDYAHLEVRNLNTNLTDFVFAPDNISGRLEQMSFQEQSGFTLQELRTSFGYTAKETYLRDLYLKTPKSILRDELVLRYKSQEQLTENLGNVQVRLQIQNSRLAYSDIIALVPDMAGVPPFSKNPNAYIAGTGLITGTVDNLLISEADFRTLEGTRLALQGRIRGLPDPDRLALDVNIRQLSSTRSDLLQMIPDGSVPTSIELPEQVGLTGQVRGTLENLTMDATLTSSLGNGSFDGNIKNATNPEQARYNGQLSFNEFDMGKLLKQPPQELGKLTLNTQLQGQGFDPATMQARVDGTVQSASIKGYEYNNLTLTGSINQGKADFEASIQDQNIALDITANADISEEYPTVQANAVVERLNLQPLNLYSENISLAGRINVDLTSTNPENPLGVISANQLVINNDGTPISIDSLNLLLQNNPGEGGREAILYSPFMKARMSGEFSYPQLGDIVMTEVNKYFNVADTAYTPVTTPYNIQIRASVANHPAIQTFVPELTTLETAQLAGRISNQTDTTLRMSLVVPLVEYDTIRVENVSMDVAGVDGEAAFSGQVGQLLYDGFRVRRAFIDGTVTNNNLLFDFAVKDSTDDNRHAISGRLAYTNEQYRFHLREGLLLDYQPWNTDSTGYVQYGPDGLLVQDFSIRRSDQQLVINSTTDQPNGPLRIIADSLAIGQFVALATQDTTLASGTLNSNILLSNYMETPAFTGDFLVNNLSFMQIPIGDLDVHATNETANRITVDASLQSQQNDVKLTGFYQLESNTPLNFDLNIQRLGAKTIEAFSFEQIRRSSGALVGQVSIRGSTESPLLNGEIGFDSLAFELAQLGTRYRINQEQIQLRGQQIIFNNFVVNDSLNHNLEVNGNVNIKNIPNVAYNLTIDATNFIVLNARRTDNEMVYGNGAIDAHINVKGVGTESIIDGTVRLQPGSNISLILPDDAAGAQSTEGVVRFVDKSNPDQPEADSTETNTGVQVDFASELSLNIEATDESQLTIIIDELNGDNLQVRGNAQLNTGIAPNGQLYLLGLYELTQGSYDLTFQVLKRQFTIQKGSQLLWTGDPMKAEVDITAVYTVNADLSPLGPTDIKGKVPLDVLLKMQGSLTNPIISFGIDVSSQVNEDDAEKIRNENLLAQLENNPAEMNKQVFALLVLNRFMGEQTASSSSGFNAEAIARQSVSQLLSEQLNMLATNFVQGVNLNFDLNSTAEGAGARTDLNVGLSRAFLDDRLTVSVGRNFELENTTTGPASNEVFDNVAVNYALTKDGRYLVRAYRKNQYQAVLEGFIIETGISFIVNLDYNQFLELFQKNKK
ncbi:translocation/assembly module TamB domain-containing protein [Telluribacter humicola]|uniref:translocation/assembly module TamB domain-containing protein n=1 Tax=Telluribacter humicola TaxID=1720261 RepID=UPI001A97063A|nr:translocation/assembly module TamB domain-containing protein [Telluribacter humicola]